MIDLLYPGEGAKYVVSIDGWLVGPIGSDGLEVLERLHYRHPEDYIRQAGGIFHESGVTHVHHDASLIYDPLRKKITANPTNVYPQQLRLTFTPKSSLDFNQGMAGGFESSLSMLSSNSICRNELCQRIGNNSWCIWTAYFYPASNKLFTLTRTTYEFVRTTSTKVYYSKTCSNYTFTGYPVVGDFSWSSRLEIKSFFEAWEYTRQHTIIPLRETTTSVSYALRVAVHDYDIKKPDEIFAAVDTHIRNILSEEDFTPPQEKHYGELAMQACERLDAINVNMIAFLRDLRNPLDMIPRLKNLRSLKGMSKNYLSVKYGILPTVSDLKRIIEAFKRVQPHLDRNGFTTCYAGSTSYGSTSLSTLTLVQRIKIGIAKEDNGFDALEQGLNNIGMFPTFENLWDLVPYSFVLDWFIDVGNFLERVDTHLRLIRLNVRYATMSRKAIVDSTISDEYVPDTYGRLQRVQYHRWVNGHAPVPPLSLQSGFTDFNHWLESAALIIQRAR